MRKFLSSTFVLFLALLSLYSCNQNDSVTSSVTGPEGNLGSAPAPKKVKMSTPVLTCDNSTRFSIEVVVTAGATGTPSGFSLHWMTKADYETYGWDTTLGCKGSFAGQARDSRYELLPNQSVTIQIGEILDDNGASTNCSEYLICGTEYVIRVFAHANSTYQRSEFSNFMTCSTLPCETSINCDEAVKSQGYWKTHDVWPVDNLTLGTVNYSQAELKAILWQSAGRGTSANALIQVAHQLIAVKLDIANGANNAITSEVAPAVAEADLFIGSLKVPPVVGGGFIAPSSISGALTDALDKNWIQKYHCVSE